MSLSWNDSAEIFAWVVGIVSLFFGIMVFLSLQNGGTLGFVVFIIILIWVQFKRYILLLSLFFFFLSKFSKLRAKSKVGLLLIIFSLGIISIGSIPFQVVVSLSLICFVTGFAILNKNHPLLILNSFFMPLDFMVQKIFFLLPSPDLFNEILLSLLFGSGISWIVFAKFFKGLELKTEVLVDLFPEENSSI